MSAQRYFAGRSVRSGLACLLLIFLMASAPGFPYPAASREQDQEPLRHEVSVTLKLIHVYVVDKKGRPVTNLVKEDFELYDSGREVKITDFERHILEGEKTEPSSESRSPAEPGLLSRQFYLFFDFAYNTSAGIQRSKEAALHFIDTLLKPTDEAGVLVYSISRSLRLYEDLTTDHGRIRKIVAGLGVRDKQGSAVPDGFGIEDMGGEAAGREDEQNAAFKDEVALASGRAGSEYAKLQARNFTGTVKDLARALAMVPGRKNILFFSSGVPAPVFEEQMALIGGGDERTRVSRGRPADRDLLSRYEDMIQTLSSANCAVFAVDSAAPLDETADWSSDATDREKERSLDWESVEKGWRRTGRSSLQELALATGGKYFGNIEDRRSITEDIENATGAFYVLGYSVHENKDGAYHDIRVKVRREGCVVQTQSGYFAPKPFGDYSKLEKEIYRHDLAFSASPRAPLGLPFPLSVVPCRLKGEAGFLMMAKLPAAGKEELAAKKIEVTELIFDAAGEARKAKRAIYDLTRFGRTGSLLSLYYSNGSRMPPGNYTYRILVMNTETGKAARSETPFVIEAGSDTRLTLYPLLVLAPAEGTGYIEGPSLDPEARPSIPLAKILGSADRHLVPLVPPDRRTRDRCCVLAQCLAASGADRSLKFTLRLTDPTTGEVLKPACRLNFEPQDDRSLLLFFDIDLAGIPPGPYRVEMGAENKRTGEKAMISVAVEIE